MIGRKNSIGVDRGVSVDSPGVTNGDGIGAAPRRSNKLVVVLPAVAPMEEPFVGSEDAVIVGVSALSSPTFRCRLARSASSSSRPCAPLVGAPETPSGKEPLICGAASGSYLGGTSKSSSGHCSFGSSISASRSVTARQLGHRN